MKTAFITTTVNVPHVLALYRKYGPDVEIFVAGDQKTPEDAAAFCQEEGIVFLDLEMQAALYPRLSALLGKNCIQRRNIAFLEALRWGAEAIVTIDDDVLPLDNQYFFNYRQYLIYQPFDGVQVSGKFGWVDPGQLLTPTIRHRGIPLQAYSSAPELSTVTDVKIGVMAGLWVGDADVDATHRIANPPAVHSVTALAEAGVVLDPRSKTVWNAQNVGFIRDLAPAMFQMPGIGRADDIFASLITQRLMRERSLYVHFGKPFTACWQNRSVSSMVRDLEEEIFLYKHTANFAEYLDSPIISKKIAGKSVLEQVRAIYDDMRGNEDFPKQAVQAGLAFCDDCEAVL